MIMDKHKLIKLILKDLEELNEIASELKSAQNLSKFELDIALSKSKLILQEFEFLKELDGSATNQEIKETSSQSITTPVSLETELTEEVKNELLNKIEASSKEVMDEKEEKVIPPNNLKDDEEITENNDSITTTTEAKNNQAPSNETNQINKGPEEDLGTDEVPSSRKTVAENFVKGKSLNDLLLESKTLDQKLASSPITKLESAIGLNDRFQYTRELFNNDPELFNKTVRKIDQSGNLNEAVNYLNSNFKWKKTDTSIQFAQLVKRRFTN